MRLSGVPKKSDLCLGDHDVSLARDDSGVTMGFKVVSADTECREAFEVLSALSVNNPARIRFELWADEDCLWLRLNPVNSRKPWVLGKVPAPIMLFATLEHNWLLFERFGCVSEFGLELSVFGKEVDRDRIMGMADDGELDCLSDEEFGELITGIKCMMSREVSVVTVSVRLSPDTKIGVLPSWNQEEVIDV